MELRQDAGADHACLLEVSRREMILGASAATIAGQAPQPWVAHPDAGIGQLKQWLILNDMIERLQDRWTRLEGWLVREQDWHRLRPAERQGSPWMRKLREIDDRLDVLFERRDGVLEALPVVGCVTMDAIVTKLAVVQHLVRPDDHPQAHALIVGTRQDLSALSVKTGIG